MGAEPRRLDDLIASVADGRPLEWDALEAGAAGEAERRMLKHLRIIAGVAEVHRTAGEDPAPGAVMPDLPAFAGPVKRWGHLLLLERLGEGSYGEVYRARDPWLDREVALKLLKGGPGGSVPVDRVLHEGRTLARVQHRNVVTVLGADVHEGRVGLWMEFVPGPTLEELITRNGPLAAEDAAATGKALCEALTAVHDAGLVHRDVKTQNVMREPGGRLVLMDFGAGQTSDRPRGVGARRVGTPLYLAPEVLNGGVATVRSDIYALGVVLFRLVTGEYPIAAATVDELTEAHTRGERRLLKDVRPDLPDAFTAVIDRACHPAPDQRFASAAEMAAALKSMSPTQRAPRLSRRMMRLAAVLGVLAVGSALAGWRIWRSPADPVVSAISVVAVLPFENVSNDPNEAYLANSVPMELSARLGDIGALQVVSWAFIKRFQPGSRTLEAVARATHADAVVEGTVQVLTPQAPGDSRQVRVRVQVYRAATGTLLWTNAYDRDFSEFLVLQSEIAQTIAQRVNAVIARREQVRLSQAPRVSAEAMEAYLRGREALEARNDIPAALELFQSAAAREPGFAQAHAGLALAYALESAYLGTVPAPAAYERSSRAAEVAIAADPELADAYAVRAFARMTLAWDWKGAAADLDLALRFNPNSPIVQDEYSNYLTFHARHEEAIAAARRAAERAPLAAAYSRKIAWALYMARRYDEAIQELRRTLTIEPDYIPARTLLGRALLLVGQHDEAIRELQAAGAPHKPKLALAYAMAGRQSDAEQLLGELTSPSVSIPVDPYELCVVYAALGGRAEALSYLDRALTQRDPALSLVLVDPMFDPLREEPAFQAAIRRVNLVP